MRDDLAFHNLFSATVIAERCAWNRAKSNRIRAVGNKLNAKEIGQSSPAEINKPRWKTLSFIGFSSNTTRVIAANRNSESTIEELDNIAVKDIVLQGNSYLSACLCRLRRYAAEKRLDWRRNLRASVTRRTKIEGIASWKIVASFQCICRWERSNRWEQCFSRYGISNILIHSCPLHSNPSCTDYRDPD